MDYRKFSSGMALILVLIVICAGVDAQQYPGSAYFKVECGNQNITFILYETPVLQASFVQISGPLSVAVATQQNQLIASGNLVSLWALKSNELQIHVNADPDATKLVVSSGICGQIPTTGSTTANTPNSNTSDPNAYYNYGQTSAVAIAQATGYGQALAVAQVIAGQALAYAQTSGNGYAYANAQSGQASAPQTGTRTHTVQRGENLFRIAIRYGTTVSELMRLNRISDPNRIYAGQTLLLP